MIKRTLIHFALLILVCPNGLAQTNQVDLVPLAEEYGVGYIFFQTGGGSYFFTKHDGEERAFYGSNQIEEYRFILRAWAVFDVSSLPSAIQVKELSINSYTYPAYDPEQTTLYRRFPLDPRALEAEACWNALGDMVYAWASVPDVASDVITVLGDTANADFEKAVKGSGVFQIGITGYEDHRDGRIDVLGWGEGRPRLTVVYEDSATPVTPTTWGQIKAQYGH